MKVDGISIGKAGAIPPQGGGVSPVAEKAPGKSFAQILGNMADKSQALSGKVSEDLSAMQTRIMGSAEVSPRELILYQIKASQFGLHVELVSKVAESMLTTVKKFQQAQ